MELKDLRILYMGTPEFAVPPLKKLVEEGCNIVGVVTAPDKPAGRGLHMQQSAVKQYALEAGLKVFQPIRLKDEEFIKTLHSLNPDLGIVIAFRMLPEVIWNMPRLGTFNLHASLLPQYRGAAPINWAIINGEAQTGLTTFMLNNEIDKGAIIAVRRTEISEEDTVETLHNRLMAMGPDMVIETIGKIISGDTVPVEQESIDAGKLKAAPKIFREDCRINWNGKGEDIRNLIRGLSPYPAAWSEMKNLQSDKEPLQVKIFSASFKPAANALPAAGSILSDRKSYFDIACADGFISIHSLQVAGKKRMDTAEFLRGVQDTRQMFFE